MIKAIRIIHLIPKLGFYNTLYAIWYKISKKYSLIKGKFPIQKLPESQFFETCELPLEDYHLDWKKLLVTKADNIMNGIFTFYSYHDFQLEEIPDWHFDPFTKTTHPKKQFHWMDIDDFGEIDIKSIWELSRFDWLTILARSYRVTNNINYLIRINELLSDWTKRNPLNQGPNWMCGQEASIRVMKMLSTLHILKQFKSPSQQIQDLILSHLDRIEANINYALIQDNNHGTSESSALYIGAAWLQSCQYPSNKLSDWKKKGRRILQNRILKLIQKDGSFSQRSTNYHRVFLDTMSFVLHMMNLLDETKMESDVLERLKKAGEWQLKLTFGSDGDVPNLGNNDGAMLENLHSCSYRDFRVSSQCFIALLLNQRVYEDVAISEAMYWRCGSKSLEYKLFNTSLPSYEFLDNHLLIFRLNNRQLLLKIPDDTFRPGNDAFHVDLWMDKKPLLIDSGTFSYNHQNSKYYKSVKAHNTVQFDNHEQMPPITRFLNGNWIKPNYIGSVKKSEKSIQWEGEYSDYKGNIHIRKIVLSNNELIITDSISTTEPVKIRYHFYNQIPKKQISITNGQGSYNKYDHSLYYMSKEEHECLEIIPTELTQSVSMKINF